MLLMTGLDIVTSDFTEHPFVLSLGGLVFWFLLKFTLQKSKKKVLGFKQYWAESFSEIVLTGVGALCFIVFDDELLLLINMYLEKDPPIVMHNAFYLLSAPVIDRLYKFFV